MGKEDGMVLRESLKVTMMHKILTCGARENRLLPQAGERVKGEKGVKKKKEAPP